jgi:putative protease
MVRMETPTISIHFGDVWDLYGLALAKKLQCDRIILSPFITRKEIATILQAREQVRPMEVQLYVYKETCPATPSSRCFFSPMARPLTHCTRNCRKQFGYTGKADLSPLWWKDISLLTHLQELQMARIDVFAIEVPLRQEEAGWMVRWVLACMDDPASVENHQELIAQALGREECSDGMYCGQPKKLYGGALTRHLRQNVPKPEETNVNLIPVRFVLKGEPGKASALYANDYDIHTVSVPGPRTRGNITAPLEAQAITRLYQSQFPFITKDVRSQLEAGISIDDVSDMKRKVLDKLALQRAQVPERPAGKYRPGVRYLTRRDEPQITVQIHHMSQMSEDLLRQNPECVYFPMEDALLAPEKLDLLHRFQEKTKAIAVLPRTVSLLDREELEASLRALKDMGITHLLVRDVGQGLLSVRNGFTTRIDLDTTNSQTLKELKAMKMEVCSLSMGLPFSVIREMSHVIPTELTIFGRVPLVHSAVCLICQRGSCACETRNELTDEKGVPHPVIRDCGHTSLLLSGEKLWLATQKSAWKHIGLWGVRLHFTTENARECVQVLQRHKNIGTYAPNVQSTGFFFDKESTS